MGTVIRTAKCAWCNEDFTYQRCTKTFCSSRCYQAARYKPKSFEQIQCQKCNKMFNPKHGGQKYCCKKCARSFYDKEQRDSLRKLILENYGNICSCCGETNYEFLTIEHIHGGGRQHKLSMNPAKYYKGILQENDHSKYTILCMNCNWARGKYGYCPHVRN